ncbi:MAG TPA: OB-fold domain-containing protein [Amycolatopsis sp.]|nr:OB-fold domain-containing protein [Amycolatopsis sp.]
MTARTSVGSVLPLRVKPFLDADNTAFWTGGADGRLMIHRCRGCGTWFHPPAPVCRACGSLEVGAEQASGRGVVASYTVNVQPWIPGAEPYIIAWVELAEQPNLRLTTNLVDIEGEDVVLGSPVEVVFEQHPDGDVWYPLFRPVDGSGK